MTPRKKRAPVSVHSHCYSIRRFILSVTRYVTTEANFWALYVRGIPHGLVSTVIFQLTVSLPKRTKHSRRLLAGQLEIRWRAVWNLPQTESSFSFSNYQFYLEKWRWLRDKDISAETRFVHFDWRGAGYRFQLTAKRGMINGKWHVADATRSDYDSNKAGSDIHVVTGVGWQNWGKNSGVMRD